MHTWTCSVSDIRRNWKDLWLCAFAWVFNEKKKCSSPRRICLFFNRDQPQETSGRRHSLAMCQRSCENIGKRVLSSVQITMAQNSALEILGLYSLWKLKLKRQALNLKPGFKIVRAWQFSINMSIFRQFKWIKFSHCLSVAAMWKQPS